MSKDLIRRLDIKAGVMEMGEKIAWGSDTALMREAQQCIGVLETKLAAAEADAARYLKALTAIDEQLSETEGCGEIDVLMGMIAREAIDAAIQKEEP